MTRGGVSPYGPSKAALEAATAVWSEDLDGTGVTVNALLPGRAADTAMIQYDDVRDRKTLLSPSVMVAPAVWLISPDSDGITGHRFIAKDWDPAKPWQENVRTAGALAAWRSTSALTG
jgi:3-oxoacyl-[acyl-carrier protein] reductase